MTKQKSAKLREVVNSMKEPPALALRPFHRRPSKLAAQEEITRLTAEYLARGGEITELPADVAVANSKYEHIEDWPL